MKIAIIGAGNVGSALSKRWAELGHSIILGMRNTSSDKARDLIQYSQNITVDIISDAIEKSNVVLFVTPPEAAVEIAKKIVGLKIK
jgi:predicted dinucleotide-binding enzyme